MKLRLALFAAVAAGSSLVVAGCGGKELTEIRGASVVPASVAAFAAIDSDPDSAQWQHATDLAGRFPERTEAISELEESLRSDAGVDFDADVKPALGPELDLVWLDFANDGQNVVALMQPDDVEAFERAVAKGNAQEPANEQLVYEEVDGWHVMSNRRAPIAAYKAAVAAGGAVLADDESFEQAMDDYESAAIVKAYISGETVMKELRAELNAEDTKLLDKLGTLDWLAAQLQTSDEGVRFDVSLRGTPGELAKTASGGSLPDFELSLPKELPGDVLAYIGFHGTSGDVSGLQDNSLLNTPELKPVADLLEQVTVLLQGENALYVRPSGEEIPELTLVAEPPDGTDGAETLDGIVEDAELGAEVERRDIAGTDTRSINLAEGLGVAWANVDGKLVVTSDLDGIAAVADPPASTDGESLSDTIHSADLPDNVQSFFYVDIRGGLGLVEKLSGAPIPDAIKRNVKPLKSAVQYIASRPSEVQFTFFLRIDEPTE